METIFKLSLIIPVWNDPVGLQRVIRQAQDLGVFYEVIICDDASDKPIDINSLGLTSDFYERIICLRNSIQRGSGHARNVGLKHATGNYIIFFDSDDLFEHEFIKIVDIVSCQENHSDFDFCIFRHNDTRILSSGGEGTFPAEEQLWQAVNAGEMPRLLREDQVTKLCKIAAYPWNKIYRTAFLRENNLQCTELPVHNDIELHWTSFLTADAILCTSLVGARHFVEEGGARLTNRRSAERLRVFEAFDAVQARLAEMDARRRINFLEPFMSFARNLLRWIADNMDAEYHNGLIERAHKFFLSYLDVDLMTILAYQNPALAEDINDILIRGKL